jgi:hypothetical protein
VCLTRDEGGHVHYSRRSLDLIQGTRSMQLGTQALSLGKDRRGREWQRFGLVRNSRRQVLVDEPAAAQPAPADAAGGDEPK